MATRSRCSGESPQPSAAGGGDVPADGRVSRRRQADANQGEAYESRVAVLRGQHPVAANVIELPSAL